MKKFKTTFKGLLLAAALLLGGGSFAWAGDVTTLYGRGTTTEPSYDITAWSEDDVTAWGGGYTIDATYGMGATLTTKTTVDKSYTFATPGENTIITYNVKMYSKLRGWDGYKNQLYLGDKIYFLINGGGTTFTMSVNGVTKTSTFSTEAILDIVCTVNTATNTITALTVKEGETTKFGLSDLTQEERILTGTPVYNKLQMKNISPNNKEHCVTGRLQRVLIQQETQVVNTYSYTVNYKESDNIVKTVSGTDNEGAVIPVISTTEAFYGTETGYTEQKFFIIADNVTPQLITTNAASNVMDIPVRRPYSTTLTVTRKFDGVAEATPYINGRALTEIDAKVHTYEYYYPFYLKVGDIYYRATKTKEKEGDAYKFGYTDEFANSAITKYIDYTTDPSVIAYLDGQGGSDKSLSLSNNEMGSTNQNVERTIATDIPAGTYELSYQMANGRGATFKYYVGEDATELESVSGSSVYSDSFTFTLPSGVTKLIAVNTSNKMYYDYFVLRKDASIASVDNLGYTFSSTLPLDFTDTDVRAYIAKYDKSTYGDVVKLTNVKKVPANTGVLIFSDSEMTNQSIPVCATTPDNVDNNCLKPVSSAMTLSAAPEGYENYVLAIDNEEGKAVFQLVSGTSASMTAGQAYLQIPKRTGEGARSLRIVFGDETTGVTDVRSKMSEVRGEYYNLSGQRVVQPTKGLYIVNGKKVIVK